MKKNNRLKENQLPQKDLRQGSPKCFFRTGDIHPINPKYIFQNYMPNGEERWTTKERREYCLKKRKEYRNQPHIKKRHSKYETERRKKKWKSDLSFRLKANLRTRISMALKDGHKFAKSTELIGCSMDFFRKHLESQFYDNMSWDNYGRGGWHVDHIKPCVAFDLSKKENQLECFHYTNLQPLWEQENLKKGGSYSPAI